MNSKKSYSILYLIVLGIIGIGSSCLFAQNQHDALKCYRNGRSLDSKGRSDDARQMYTQAIDICRYELEKNPKNLDSYTVYTWSLFRLHRYKDTADICRKALKIAPDGRIIETLGEACFYLNDYNEALHQMERYISMNSLGERVSVAYFYVGDIYRLTKKYQKADIAYSAALHLNPENALWWYRLGLAREHAGQKKDALDAYEKAIKIRKDYHDATEGIKRLNS